MLTPAERTERIERIRALPAQLEALIAGKTDQQLDAPTSDVWTARQHVHHIADSHMNAFIRTKLALTESEPTIKPYHQDEWVTLADATQVPASVSLGLLKMLHERWVTLYESLTDDQWTRSVFHPEQQRLITLDDMLITYSNHGEGHLTQIKAALASA